MEANQILQSALLDILFEGKNKAYGAYELRKTYNRRIATALSCTIILLLFFMIAYNISLHLKKDEIIRPMITDPTVLKSVPPDKPQQLLPLKPPPPTHAKTIKFPPPIIVRDPLVNEVPPEVKELEEAKIDLKTVDGSSFTGIVAPPSDIEGSQVTAAPVSKKTHDDVPFISVEIEAEFPGGPQAWQRYIRKAIIMQLDEFSDADYGTCVVQFIVDKNGNVSHVQATTMQGTKLAEIAVSTIRKGPHWTPAIQNGIYVNAYRTQPVTLNNPNE
jgi:protein TonB